MDNELNEVISSVSNLLERRNDAYERSARYAEQGRLEDRQALQVEIGNIDEEIRNQFRNNGTMQEVIDQFSEFRRLSTEKARLERDVANETNETRKNSLSSELESVNQRLRDMLNVAEPVRGNNNPVVDNSNANRGWGPLSEAEIDDAIQLGFTEYTPGDDADFDRFLVDHGYNPEKLKAELDSVTRDSNTNRGWGPLSEEEIDDAIQLGFTEYTPGDDADFDRFLVDHGYDPEKLKAELDNGKDVPTKNNPEEKKEKEAVEIAEGTIGQGLSLDRELRRIFNNKGIPATDKQIAELVNSGKTEINGEEYQIDYSGADGKDYTDEPATPFKLVVMKDKAPEKGAEGRATGTDGKDPVGGEAAVTFDINVPDPAKDGAEKSINPDDTNPDKDAGGTIDVKPEDVKGAEVETKGISSEIRYDGDNYILTRTVDGKVENEATFSRFEKAEVRSNRKRVKILKENEDIAEFLKVSKEKEINITNKQLKLADPTILRGLTSNKTQYGLALTYLRQLAKGKDADRNKLKSEGLGDVSISYNVPVDDPKVGFMTKIAKKHRNIGDVNVPSFTDRVKFFFGNENDKLEGTEERKALDAGSAKENEKVDDINEKPTYSWDLSEEDKESAGKYADAVEKKKAEKEKEKKEFIINGLKKDSKEYLEELEKTDPEKAEEFKKLTTNQERMNFRVEELKKEFYDGKYKKGEGIEK